MKTVFLIALLLFSVCTLDNEIRNVEDLITLVNSKEFEDYVEQHEDDDVKLQSIFGGDECLVSSSDAKNLLKNGYGITNNSPDKRIRFILGRCSPVLLIPGIYASKLLVEVQCKNLATYEKTTTLKEIRLFCGDSICEKETVEREEHPLFIGLLDKAFSILGSEKDKYSSCLGYFMNHFQNQNECPAVNGKRICKHSPYIKVSFYGGTTKTESKGRCGVEGVQNVIQSGILTVDNIVNIGAAKSYETISNTLKKRGYEEGFSLGGLPNDYRRYLATNNFSKKVFKSQIERLYSNTGKPVIIVAHSFGTLLTLTNLVRTENKNLLPKIKKFVAIAPPFAGSSMLLDIFLHGMNEWNKSFNILGKTITITNYNIFGQNMMYKSIPVITELRPLPIAAKIFTDSTYKELGDAIKERISYEKKCRNTKCTDTTPLFDKLFKGYYPSVTDSECSYENIEDSDGSFSRKCFTNIYNVGECPTILTKTSTTSNPYGNNVENYCGQKTSSFFYQGECTSSNSNCLDRVYSEKGPYAYDNAEAVEYLLNRYNKDFAKTIDGVKLTKSFFETKTQAREGSQKSIDYHSTITLIKDLPAPPVDTDLVYASFANTPAAFILYDKDFTLKGNEYSKGGDGTVPTWSSLLTGLKWLYDKKVGNLKYKYRLVEYCSRLAESGQYKYDPNKDQKFIALGCSCINSKNKYKSDYGDCTHAALINDDDFVDYIISVVDDPKETNTVTNGKKTAITNYNSRVDFATVCNADLKNILETAQ